MPDKKLTDNEIKKALEWCEQFENNLVLVWKSEDKYTIALKTMQTIKSVLKDYNRLQAENERLTKENTILSQNADNAFQDGLNEAQDLYAEQVKAEIKAEAYKECIKKIKVKSKKEHLVCSGAGLRTDYTITDKELDNLLKELVGEDNAQ